MVGAEHHSQLNARTFTQIFIRFNENNEIPKQWTKIWIFNYISELDLHVKTSVAFSVLLFFRFLFISNFQIHNALCAMLLLTQSSLSLFFSYLYNVYILQHTFILFISFSFHLNWPISQLTTEWVSERKCFKLNFERQK